MFKDITPLLADPKAFRSVIDRFAEKFNDSNVDVIVAAEARGFFFGAPLALEIDASFVPVRKPGKLPYDTKAHTYDLEYGTDTLEIHVDGVEKGQNVLIVDDLLATGGTVQACCNLIKEQEANVVACAFVIELEFLGGSEKLKPHESFSLISY